MEKVKLHQLLSQLRNELEQLDTNSETHKEISNLVTDIENQIEELGHKPSLTESLQLHIKKFEVEHPKVTAILNDIMIKLSSMGI
ncbi:MAG: DUF4404 family protein [Gammaproteobacteria bacterium]|nr:DUF4404 family protein [Gammaproteobacteria bacterium]